MLEHGCLAVLSLLLCITPACVTPGAGETWVMLNVDPKCHILTARWVSGPKERGHGAVLVGWVGLVKAGVDVTPPSSAHVLLQRAMRVPGLWDQPKRQESPFSLAGLAVCPESRGPRLALDV